jgi:hypothetical protein
VCICHCVLIEYKIFCISVIDEHARQEFLKSLKADGVQPGRFTVFSVVAHSLCVYITSMSQDMFIDV